ncbi:MAG: hypothetical protein K5765_03250 [Clostridia bacterium]|nr:hypothetical protein [Clostridia bacterium]
MDLLKNSFGYFSARRATMLEDSLIYLFAASKILNKRFSIETSFSNVAYLHIQNTLPNIANEYIDKVLLMNICEQALKISNLADSIEKEILLISDPIERLKVLIKNKKSVKIEIINDVITSSLNEITDSKIRRAMALFTYLSFRSNRNIHAAVIETLANEIRPVLATRSYSSVGNLIERKYADSIVSLMNDIPWETKYRNYLNNYLYSYLPNGYSSEDEPKKLFDFFVKNWEELNL